MKIRKSTIKRRYVGLAVAAAVVVAVPVMPSLASASPVSSSSSSALPASSATTAQLVVPAAQKVAGAPKITWPAYGRARLEVAGLGEIGEIGNSTEQRPIGSITKVMTAYTILKDHPLKAGAAGPKIKITKADVKIYNRLKAQGASLVKVKAGSKLTERQALQGLLMASGSNLAETLARWDVGSTAKFVTRMNANAKRLGLDSTSFADSSGLSEMSGSSTEDLIDLAQAAMKKPAFREVVGSKKAKIPVAGTLHNTNPLLGSNGVIGIKTGTTTPAGGCLLFAATDKVDGKTYTVYGTLLGVHLAPYSANAKKFSKGLIIAARKELREVTLLKKGRTLVSVTKPDGTVHTYGVKKAVTAAGWSGLPFTLSLPKGLTAGQTPKIIIVKSGSRTLKVALAPLS